MEAVRIQNLVGYDALAFFRHDKIGIDARDCQDDTAFGAFAWNDFLAAFAAGLTIAASDAELCDCFLDLGQAGAEMFLLFTFVAFGSSLIWTGLREIGWLTLAFAVVALGARSLVLAGVHVVIGLIWLVSYAYFFSRVSDVLRRPRMPRALEGVTGALLIGFGGRLACERRQ